MKRNFILFTIFLMLTACSSNKPNSLSEQGLKGNVKTVALCSFETKKTSNGIEKDDIISHWDVKHNLNIDQISISTYDNNGNIISKEYYDEYRELSNKHIYTYLNENLISLYKYDNRDRVTYSWELILEKEKPINVKINKDTYHDCIFEGFNLISYKVDRPRYRIIEQTYENNFLCKSVTKTSDGDTTRCITKKWNEAGQLLYEEDAVEHDASEIFNYEYNEVGHIIKYTREYGRNTPTIYTFEYLTFDDKGNWTERVIYSNDTPHIIQERIIEYY